MDGHIVSFAGIAGHMVSVAAIQFCQLLNSAIVKTATNKVKVKVAKSCPTLCDPHSLPGSSVHGILQARIPEWVAIPFSRGSS